jgi:hypothetical protein
MFRKYTPIASVNSGLLNGSLLCNYVKNVKQQKEPCKMQGSIVPASGIVLILCSQGALFLRHFRISFLKSKEKHSLHLYISFIIKNITSMRQHFPYHTIHQGIYPVHLAIQP